MIWNRSVLESKLPYWEWLKEIQRLEGIILTARFAANKLEVTGVVGWVESFSPIVDEKCKPLCVEAEWAEREPKYVYYELVESPEEQARKFVEGVYKSTPETKHFTHEFGYAREARPNVVVLGSKFVEMPHKNRFFIQQPINYFYADEKIVAEIKLETEKQRNKRLDPHRYLIIGPSIKDEVGKRFPSLPKW